MGEKAIEYLFVYDGQQWWLKLTEADQIIGMAQLDNIKQYGAVFINPAGGHTHGVETVQFCRRKQLVFPDFKKEDIRVRKFNGGQHWYAYIGDMQVRDGDRLKWNTKDAAQAAAEALVTEQEEEKFLNGWDGSKCIYYTDEKCLYFNDSEAPCHHCTHYTE